jgi:RNA polymerase sigma-70 factor (ECF subfamily)
MDRDQPKAPSPIDVAALYTRYAPMVLRRCRALLHLEAEAADAMQDVFVRLLISRDRLDDSGLSSLLYRMATQVSLNRMRSRRRRPEDAQDPQDSRSQLLRHIAAATSAEEKTQARSLLARLFSREPESSAVIAVLHLYDGLTLEEVAAEVGMSVSGVRKRLRRLEAGLREISEGG